MGRTSSERFDVVFASDIHVQGGTNAALASQIEFMASQGYRVGIVPMHLPHAQGERPVYTRIRKCVSEGKAEIVERHVRSVDCQLFIVDNPSLMHVDVDEFPALKVAADKRVMIVPFPPKDGRGITYEPVLAQIKANQICRGPYLWAPVSPMIRAQVAALYPHLAVTRTEPTPILDPKRYGARQGGWNPEKLVIGRHSRADREKWPKGRAQFLKVYPASKAVTVKFLGIRADQLEALIGAAPANYSSQAYNEVDPAEFLRGLDLFVYYHHPTWIEALGIVILEAMLARVPCFLPEYMRENFGDAAFYAEPAKLWATIRKTLKAPAALAAHVERAHRFAAKRYGPAAFKGFLDEMGCAPRVAKSAPAKRRCGLATALDLGHSSLALAAALEHVALAKEAGKSCVVVNSGGDAACAYARSFLAGIGVSIAGNEPIEAELAVLNDPHRGRSRRRVEGLAARRSAIRLSSGPDVEGSAGNVLAVAAALGGAQFQPLDQASRLWLERFAPNADIAAANVAPILSRFSLDYARRLRRSARPAGAPVGFLAAGPKLFPAARMILAKARRLRVAVSFFGLAIDEDEPLQACGAYPSGGLDIFRWTARLSRLCLFDAADPASSDLRFAALAAAALGVPASLLRRFGEAEADAALRGGAAHE